MLFYPSKTNNRLNRQAFQPELVNGRVMINPHYPVVIAPDSNAIIDSTAFQTMLERKTPGQALDDQLRFEEQQRWHMYEATSDARYLDDWHAEALVHYDQMLGVDEAYTDDGKKIKRRGDEESAQQAIAETLHSAQYYYRQRDRVRGAIAYAAQGVHVEQYINECVLPLLDLMRPHKDWLALGGFCIIGRVPSLKPHFIETLRRVLPLCKAKGVPRIHILGVCVADMITLATAEARTYGVAISTDSSSIEVNSIMGKVWEDGRWHKRYSKAEKYTHYWPAQLSIENIGAYHAWTQTL